MVVREEDAVGTWPDGEDVGKAILRQIEIVNPDRTNRPIQRVGREVKAGTNLDGGTIRVERTGGAPNTDETADNALLELAMFGTDYDQVKAIKAAVWRAMKAVEGELVVLDDGTEVYVHSATLESGAIRPPWSIETSTRRSIETWRLSWPPLLPGA